MTQHKEDKLEDKLILSSLSESIKTQVFTLIDNIMLDYPDYGLETNITLYRKVKKKPINEEEEIIDNAQNK